jgi:carbamoyl-phosphate synthase small subunit
MKNSNSKVNKNQVNLKNNISQQQQSVDLFNNRLIVNKNKNAVLIFPDSECFYGYGIGKMGKITGEICFNTSITGYQEIITDPSYSGQIINFTFPHIGNVGVNDDDIESKQVRAKGLIVRELVTNPSNYRANSHFENFLIKNNLTGIANVDTRAITKKIRQSGANTVAIIYQDEEINKTDIEKTIKEINSKPNLQGVELASIASENKNYNWGNQGSWNVELNSYETIKKLDKTKNTLKVVAIDFGAKLNILRCLTQLGIDVEVVGAKASFDEILSLKPDGIFLSNGPGDPAQTAKYSNEVIKKILSAKIPLFGICLGHQLIALALGAKTIKMAQGHRGANHPVKNLLTNKVEITSQNHGFCVDEKTLPSNVEITHISLFDKTIEGLRVKDSPVFCVQYHPESSPGPSDSFYLFNDFLNLILEFQKLNKK